MNKLSKVVITKAGPDSYRFSCDGVDKTFTGSFGQLAHLLSKMKVGDNETSPRSKRKVPLKKMMSPIKKGGPVQGWVFNHVFNNQFESLAKDSASLKEASMEAFPDIERIRWGEVDPKNFDYQPIMVSMRSSGWYDSEAKKAFSPVRKGEGETYGTPVEITAIAGNGEVVYMVDNYKDVFYFKMPIKALGPADGVQFLQDLPDSIVGQNAIGGIRREEIEEASTVLRDFAKKSGKSMAEIEDFWKEAKNISAEFFGTSENNFTDQEWAYATGILKNMLGLRENYISIQIPSGDIFEYEVRVTTNMTDADEWYTVLGEQLAPLITASNPHTPAEIESVEATEIDLDDDEPDYSVFNAKAWIDSGLSAEEFIRQQLHGEDGPQVSTSFSVGDKNPVVMKKDKKKKQLQGDEEDLPKVVEPGSPGKDSK